MSPERTACVCGCLLQRIGQDVAEKLDTDPACSRAAPRPREVGVQVCTHCETLIQVPGGATHDRQGHPDGWVAPTGVGGQRPQPAALQTGRHLRPRRARDPALYAGRLGRSAACNCSRWWVHSSARCSRRACCMPTRRRWRCSSPSTADAPGVPLGYCTTGLVIGAPVVDSVTPGSQLAS